MIFYSCVIRCIFGEMQLSSVDEVDSMSCFEISCFLFQLRSVLMYFNFVHIFFTAIEINKKFYRESLLLNVRWHLMRK